MRRRYNVAAEVFVRTWQASKTAQEVADRLGMPKPIAMARASGYRKLGIQLKPMPRVAKKVLDVAALKKLAEQKPPKKP